jgi:GxxExxY protein
VDAFLDTRGEGANRKSCDLEPHESHVCGQMPRSLRGIGRAAVHGMDNDSHPHDPETYSIFGAALTVHTELGKGFLEAVYKHALVFELQSRAIPFQTEAALPISYKGQRLPVTYRADLVCYADLIVEIKALPAIGPADIAQVINYLKASGFHRGLLINFGGPSLQSRRLVWGDP